MQAEAKIIRLNTQKVFESLTNEELYSGKDWYGSAHIKCKKLALENNVCVEKVVGIFSAFSPIKSVEQCWLITEDFLKGKEVFTVGAQIKKAKSILGLADNALHEIKPILGGLKTQSFYDAIFKSYGYSSNDLITIDSHMFKLAPSYWRNLTPVRYKLMSDSIKSVNFTKDLKPHQFQAVLWTKLKQVSSIREI
jgi:hypothetical protein